MDLFLPIILGTAREGRNSERVANFVLAEFQKRENITTEIIDVRDWLKPATKRQLEEHAGQDALAEKIQRADGYLIVSPEYNHGYPGELKMFLDTFYKEYARKPAGVIGVSDGPIGGARMLEQLRLVLITLGLVAIRAAAYFPNAPKQFDEHGNVADPSYAKKLAGLFAELEWYARALKTARENSPAK